MKHILFTIIALTASISCNAQSLKELLLTMPSEICPLMSDYNRLELVDNQKNKKPLRTTNLLQTTSEMPQLTDNFARLKTTKNTEKTFKLLKTNAGETIIAVVSTVFIDDVPDSHIDFYNEKWQDIGTEGRISFNQQEGFHYIELSRDNDDIRLMTGTPLSINLDNSNKIEKPKAKSQTFKWTGEKFE